jgi:hypothetical protein
MQARQLGREPAAAQADDFGVRTAYRLAVFVGVVE